MFLYRNNITEGFTETRDSKYVEKVPVLPPCYRTQQYCSNLKLLEVATEEQANSPCFPEFICNCFSGACLLKQVFSSFTTVSIFECI